MAAKKRKKKKTVNINVVTSCETKEKVEQVEEKVEQIEENESLEESIVQEEKVIKSERNPYLEMELKTEFAAICAEKRTTLNDESSVIEDTQPNIKNKFNEHSTQSIRQVLQKVHNKLAYYKFLYIGTWLLLVSLGVYAVYSYIFERPNPVEVKTEEVVEVEPEQNFFVDIDQDTKKNSDVVYWNTEFKDAINNYLQKYTYFDLVQTTNATNKKGSKANVALTTHLTTDFSNNRVYCNTDIVDDIGTKHNEYFYDKANNLYLTRYEDEWTVSKKVAVTVNFNIEEYNDCAEFYKYLLNDFTIRNNTDGQLLENYVYFTYVRNGVKRDLKNITYDKLGDTTIQLVFEKISDTEYKPLSMIKQVEFESNETLYTSKLVLQLNTISTDTLTVPEYNEFITIPYEDEDEEVIEEEED